MGGFACFKSVPAIFQTVQSNLYTNVLKLHMQRCFITVDISCSNAFTVGTFLIKNFVKTDI